ncbi:MAG TPA: HD domain-containing phosphohydrolase, partial [Candidatus Deferrimicrobiaceae bacterium]|nr:HD domain-containing phosphohydrolase [Candidatus Deferrimicrobiaceae bacterium]
GAVRLRKVDCGSILPMIVSFEHHMKYDRAGYPRVHYRGALNIASYMTQIADVYDALRTNRPYRKELGLEHALSIMRWGKGTEFEPTLFDNFVSMIIQAHAGKPMPEGQETGNRVMGPA